MERVKFNFDEDPKEINYDGFSKGETWNGFPIVYVNSDTFTKIKDILFDIEDMSKSDILDEFNSFVSGASIHNGEVIYSLLGFCVHIVAKQVSHHLWEHIQE